MSSHEDTFLFLPKRESIVKPFPIFREKIFCDIENRVGDEEGGEYVDRIVDVAHKDDSTEEDRDCGEEIEEFFVGTEDESHKEGEPRVGGEEEVSSEGKLFNNVGGVVDSNLSCGGSDMSERNKDRTNENKEGDAFDKKRDFFGATYHESGDKNPEKNRAVDKNSINIVHTNVIEDNIGDGIRNRSCGVNPCLEIGKKTHKEKEPREPKCQQIIFVEPVGFV